MTEVYADIKFTAFAGDLSQLLARFIPGGKELHQWNVIALEPVEGRLFLRTDPIAGPFGQIHTNIPCEGEKGVCVSLRKLHEWLKTLDKEQKVTFKMKDVRVLAKCKKSQCTLHTIGIGELREGKSQRKTEGILIDTEKFFWLQKLAKFTGKDGRYTHLYFDRDVAFCTNGHVGGLVEISFGENVDSFALEAENLAGFRMFLKTDEIYFQQVKNGIYFYTIGDTPKQLFILRADVATPGVRDIVDAFEPLFEVGLDTSNLIPFMKFVKRGESHTVYFDFLSQIVGYESVEEFATVRQFPEMELLEGENQEGIYGMNRAYLTLISSIMPKGYYKLQLKSNKEPIIFRSSLNFLYFIMMPLEWGDGKNLLPEDLGKLSSVYDTYQAAVSEVVDA